MFYCSYSDLDLNKYTALNSLCVNNGQNYTQLVQVSRRFTDELLQTVSLVNLSEVLIRMHYEIKILKNYSYKFLNFKDLTKT